jgi:hypothetical protein
LDANGAFQPARPARRIQCIKGSPRTEALIRKEVEFVKSETAKKVEKLNLATDKHTGLEILHLFIMDLLGRNTPAARIFETKSEEDFEHTRVVTVTSKRMAVVALVLINFFFVYFAMLTGFRRGLSWQRTYLVACIMQFVVEVILFETMECVWINCAIPALVSNEVRMAGQSVIEVVQHLCANGVVESEMFLNAPDYLFVSTNVAKKFSHLMESILVQAYVSHLPGELAKTWQEDHSNMARIQRGRTLRSAASLMLMLQYIGTAPFIMHRLFIRFVQPFFFSGLVILWALVVNDPIYLSVLCVVVAAVAAYAVYSVYYDHGVSPATLHGIAPALPTAKHVEDWEHTGTNDRHSGSLHMPLSQHAESVMPFSADLSGHSPGSDLPNSAAEAAYSEEEGRPWRSHDSQSDHPSCVDIGGAAPSRGRDEADSDAISEVSQISMGVIATAVAESGSSVAGTSMMGDRAHSVLPTSTGAASRSVLDAFSNRVQAAAGARRAHSVASSSAESVQFSDTSSSGTDSDAECRT